MSKSLFGRSLRIVLLICGIAVLPAIALSLRAGYYMLVPRYSAVVDFEKLGFNLRLDLFLSGNEASDSGRHLSVIYGGSYQTRMLQGWDWAHRARTSIYRIDDNHLAVLSALGYDYRITLKPFEFAPLVSAGGVPASGVPDNGEQWQYLGAFDFTFPSNGRPRLQFFDPQVAECIPMGTIDPSRWAGKPRPQARRDTCPSPRPDQGVP